MFTETPCYTWASLSWGLCGLFESHPRKQKQTSDIRFPKLPAMPQPETGGPLSPLLLHGVWWELALSYNLHLLYTLNYREILT